MDKKFGNFEIFAELTLLGGHRTLAAGICVTSSIKPLNWIIFADGDCNNVKEGLSRPHRSNRWNKSSHSCRQISSEVAGKPPQFIN
ncbi:hypothetical protein ACTXT7_009289 [Hymenolepis weldensis]